VNAPQRRCSWRGYAATGLILVLAGCTSTGGGCSPIDSATTTTDPGGSTSTTVDPTTTTTEPGGSTSTTIDTGSTTTTVDPGGSTTTTSTTVPGGGEVVPVAELGEGDCLTPVGEDLLVENVAVIDCDQAHEAEVYAQFPVADGELPDAAGTPGYPGGSELTWFAQDACQERFDDYVGESYWDSRYDLKVITPSFSTWDAGDRKVTCLLVDGDGDVLTGSGKG
jgi:Septum formation